MVPLFKGVAIAVPVQAAWLRWGSCADQFMPTIPLFLLANKLSFIKVTSRQGQGQVLPSPQVDKAKDFPDLLCLFAVPLLFLQATRHRAGFEPSSFWGSSLGLGTFLTILLSSSGTFSCLSQQRAPEGNLGMSRECLGMPWSHLTQSKKFALEPPEEMPPSQRRICHFGAVYRTRTHSVEFGI